MVERGVAERVRLKQTYDKRTDELQKQHDAVRNALAEHRSKVGVGDDGRRRRERFLFIVPPYPSQARQILDKDAESRSCVSNNGFLVLFHGPHHHGCTGAGVPSSGSATIAGNNLTLSLDAGAVGGGGAMAISPAKSHNSITTEMKT